MLPNPAYLDMSTTQRRHSPLFMYSNPLLISLRVVCCGRESVRVSEKRQRGVMYVVGDVVVDRQLAGEVVVDEAGEPAD